MTDKGLISHIYKQFIQLNIKTTTTTTNKLKKPNFINGQKIWIDIFPERKCRWPTHTHEKMLNIISHQGNANQNHIWFVRMSIIKKYINEKCWWGCKEKGTSVHSWHKCKLWTVWRFRKRLKIELCYDPLIPLLGIYLKKQKKLIRKDTSTPYIHTSILYNGQDREAI